MDNCYKPLFILLFHITSSTLVNAQVTLQHLVPLVSISDQNSLKKQEVTFAKGKKIDDDAQILKNSGTSEKEKTKNNKKYNLKRLEASQFFHKSNNGRISLLKENITRYLKTSKSIETLSNIKSKEDNAYELIKKAKILRKESEKLTYPEEKLLKIIEAEEIEKEAITIYIKVLYAYLNQPIEYDIINYTPINAAVKTKTSNSKSKKFIKKNENTIKGIELLSSESPKDTIISEKNSNPSDSLSETKILQENNSKITSIYTSSIYEKINITEKQVDSFNKFLEEAYPENYANYIINFHALNYGDVDSLKEAWHKYWFAQYSGDIIKNKTENIDSIPLIAEKTTKKLKSDPEFVKKLSNKENGLNNNKKLGSNTKLISEETNPAESNIETGISFERAKGFIYRIQILACRIPVNSNVLDGIYNGNLTIVELNEDKWFKYAVGEFNSYTEAKQIIEQINIPGSFVIAYLNGKRIQILSTGNSQLNYSTLENTSKLIYKVQIAASKVPLHENYIKNIYSGPNKIEELIEEGWFKYSLVFGPEIRAAINFINKENISGAFITSYMGKEKIELKNAIRISNQNK